MGAVGWVVLRVDIHSAKPGMVLALPLRQSPNAERNLLNAGFSLTSETIARVRGLGVRDVWIRYPGLDALDKFIDPAVIERRTAIVTGLKKNFEQAQTQSSVRLPYEQYMRQVASLVEDLLKNRTAALFLDEAGGADPTLLDHCSTVSYLSLMMGMKLDAYLIRQRKRLSPIQARKVGNLGVGAMLHDIGLLKLEPGVVERHRLTGDDTDPAWRAHVRLGYELVRGQTEPSAAVIVLDHHQRFDGTGFPASRDDDGSRLARSGDQIHIFARICSVADMFDELRRPLGEPPRPAVAALVELLKLHEEGWFDPIAVQALLQVVPPYAPGSIIRLSDGRHATPLEHSPDDPCRPRVQIIPDPSDLMVPENPAEQPIQAVIDLKIERQLHVAWAEGRSVGRLNFDPPNLFANNPERREQFVG
jgi:HD-GYP domain-containing protein (c-di-GMP phosphodiesterase class II)